MGSFKIWKKEYSADEVLKEVAKLSKEEIVEENKEYLKNLSMRYSQCWSRIRAFWRLRGRMIGKQTNGK